MGKRTQAHAASFSSVILLGSCPVDDHEQSIFLDSLAALSPDSIQMEVWVHGRTDHIPEEDQGRVHCFLLVSEELCGYQTGNSV